MIRRIVIFPEEQFWKRLIPYHSSGISHPADKDVDWSSIIDFMHRSGCEYISIDEK